MSLCRLFACAEFQHQGKRRRLRRGKRMCIECQLSAVYVQPKTQEFMAEIAIVEPVVRICAVISRHEDARRWGMEKLKDEWGDLALCTQPLPFPAGGFYENSMGPDLQKILVATSPLEDCGGLAEWKLQTNNWEKEYAEQSDHSEARPLNLDPGYVTQAKLILATTKDRDHRIYLQKGIFAEVTLNYVGKKWIYHRWSYPDYRTEPVANFCNDCRQLVREEIRLTGGDRRRGVK